MIPQTSKGFKTVILLAFPIVIENALQVILGTTDLFFAGTLGDGAIASVGIVCLIMGIFQGIYGAIGIGVVAIVSRKVGAANKKEASEASAQALMLALTIGIVLGVVSWVLCEPILFLCGLAPDVMEFAVPYYLTVAVPSVFLSLTLVLSSCFRATGDTKTPMVVTALSMVVNAFLDYALITLGVGIIGIGLATTFSRLLSTVILLALLFKGTEWIHLRKVSWKPDRALIAPMACIGVPAAGERLIMKFGQLIYNTMIISLGTSVYVAHTVAGNIEQYSYILAAGFATSTATLVGLSLGKQSASTARLYIKISAVMSVASLIPLTAVLLLFAEPLTRFFTDSTDAIEMSVAVLTLIAFFQPLIALSQTFTGALQGAGDTKFPLYTTFVGTWVLRIGVGWILAVPVGLGLFGVWCAYVLDLIVRTILLALRLKHGKWETIDVTKGWGKHGEHRIRAFICSTAYSFSRTFTGGHKSPLKSDRPSRIGEENGRGES